MFDACVIHIVMKYAIFHGQTWRAASSQSATSEEEEIVAATGHADAWHCPGSTEKRDFEKKERKKTSKHDMLRIYKTLGEQSTEEEKKTKRCGNKYVW
jgi:hypothetical protein